MHHSKTDPHSSDCQKIPTKNQKLPYGSHPADLCSDPEYQIQMLLISSPNKVDGSLLPENVIYLETPLKTEDMVASLNMMLERVSIRRKKARQVNRERSQEEQETIRKAKELLMERHKMTEPEAHKYLQKCSMDSGTGIVETAEMIISLTSV